MCANDGRFTSCCPGAASNTPGREAGSPLLSSTSIESLGISLYTFLMSTITDRLVTKDDLERSLKDLEYRLIIRLGGMIVVAIGVIASLVKLL